MNNAGDPINADLLDLLRCPETESRLAVADAALLTQLNNAIACGTLLNSMGQRVTQTLDAALVNTTQTLAYPVFDRIPVMVSGEAIPLDSVSAAQNRAQLPANEDSR